MAIRPLQTDTPTARAWADMDMAGQAAQGALRVRGSPLFQEWLDLASGGDGGEVVPSQISPMGPDDALIIIDMQKDFVPCTKTNEDGGRFGVPEGDLIVSVINQLIGSAVAAGATVVATRDYHPADHVSFVSEGGPFPEHCVQGTAGAELIPSLARALQQGWEKDPSKVIVAFKAFHEDVDSFGGFPYLKGGPGRVQLRQPGSESKRCPMGCHACPWTGCLVVKQSALMAATRRGEPADMDAPPDMLCMLSADEDGERDRGRRALQDVVRGAKRIFVCGLALDFCVLDTCLNALDAGLQGVHLLLDAARAAHIAGVGGHGTGFLSDPTEVVAKLGAAGVVVTSSEHAMGQALAKTNLAKLTKAGTVSRHLLFPNFLAPLDLDVQLQSQSLARHVIAC